jgi:hypothetical protein
MQQSLFPELPGTFQESIAPQDQETRDASRGESNTIPCGPDYIAGLQSPVK